jgi:isoquinoline 1-oxidoreductase subunit beta
MSDGHDDNAGISRRKLLIGGGVGAGLLIAWSLWPRQYQPNLVAANGEHLFGPWLKIAEDGKVIVAIPQSESGQGVYTALAQIVAGELGADWRSVAVQPVSASPLFANELLAREWTPAFLPTSMSTQNAGSFANGIIAEIAERDNFVMTGGSSPIRQFELPCREAVRRRRRAGIPNGRNAGPIKALLYLERNVSLSPNW